MRITCLLTTILLFSAVGQAFAVPDCTAGNATTLDGSENNLWTEDDNWNNGQPDKNKIACIPAGKTVVIDSVLGVPTDAEADLIYIKSDTTNGAGKMTLELDNTLTLFNHTDASQIDGELEVEYDGALMADVPGAMDDVSIAGKGGVIEGVQFYTIPGFIKTRGSCQFGSNDGGTCTQASECPLGICTMGTLTVECDASGDQSREECLVITGALDITAKLVNNAYVVANQRIGTDPYIGPIFLTTHAKSGDGYWIAEHDTVPNPDTIGLLDVQIAVSGAATWVVQGHQDVELRLNAASTSLTGDVQVTNGTFLIRQNFETTGNLTMDDQGGPQIVVRQGKIAKFNVTP